MIQKKWVRCKVKRRMEKFFQLKNSHQMKPNEERNSIIFIFRFRKNTRGSRHVFVSLLSPLNTAITPLGYVAFAVYE